MSDYEPPMPIMKAVAASISQNMEQNVRTREEIETELQRLFTHGVRGPNAAWQVAHRIFDEVRAYGAAEQRRKDVEGQEPVAWQWLDAKSGWLQVIHDDPAAHVKEMEEMGIACRPVYLGPANVAALEVRVKELEAALAAVAKIAVEHASEKVRMETALVEIFQTPGKAKEISAAALTREGGV